MADSSTRYLTPFPSLHDRRISDSKSRDYTKRSFIQEAYISKNFLIQCWASLLARYVPGDEMIIGLEKGLVIVDSANLDLTFQDVDGLLAGSGSGIKWEQDEATEDEHQSWAAKATFFARSKRIMVFISSDLFPEHHVESFVHQLQLLLRDSQSKPDVSILNLIPVHQNGHKLLHSFLENGRPEDVAIDFMDEDQQVRSFHYRDLNTYSTKLAHTIRNHLSKTSDKQHFVPILLPQSPEMYVAIFGVLKAGAAFCPISVDSPLERIRFILQDVGSETLITSKELAAKFTDLNTSFITISENDISSQNKEDTSFSPSSDTDSLAYVMYTSGSTGTPKGVSISHSAITQSLLAHDKHIPQFKRFLQFAAPTFDVSIFELFFPLLRGATVVGCHRALLLNDLVSVINDLEIDALELTPTMAQSTLIGRRGDIKHVKCLLTIGEMLTQDIVDEYGCLGEDNGILYGMYGPTEAAVHATVAVRFRAQCKSGLIGVPLDTVSCFIMKPKIKGSTTMEEALPIGYHGELVLGGLQTANGYLNRSEQTTSVFFDHPNYGRLYRTGDRARLLASGNLECLGRILEDQVKLKGMRVELGEIEGAICRLPGVHGCVVSVANSGQMLVAFVAADSSVNKETIRNGCKDWLPSSWMPNDIILLNDGRLPTLASGKADRKKLLELWHPELLSKTASRSFAETFTNAERLVFGCLKQAFGERDIGLDNSFTSAGVDSMIAIRLVSSLRKAGATSIQVSNVLDKEMTIRKLASHVGKPAKKNKDVEIGVQKRLKNFRMSVSLQLSKAYPNAKLHRVQDILPCTKLQEAMLVETVCEKSAYCNWILLEVKTAQLSITVKDLEVALETLIQSHQILRTAFMPIDNELVSFAQIIWKERDSTQICMSDSINKNSTYQLDISLRPPVTFSLIDRGHKVDINVNLHHALYDGWSWECVMDDLFRIIKGRDLKPRALFNKVVEFGLAQDLDQDTKTKSVQYWKNQLEGVTPSKLPNFHGRNDIPPGVDTHSRYLSSSTFQLDDAAKSSGVNPLVFLQNAWGTLLALYTGSDDVVFGTTVSGRTIPVTGIEDIIGPCIATLPVRFTTGSNRNLDDAMKKLHDFNRSMLNHTTLSLREINHACGMSYSTTLFDTLLVWQQTGQGLENKFVHQTDGRDRLEFALTIEVTPVDHLLELRVTYQQSILPVAQVEMLMDQLDTLISFATSHQNADIKNAFNQMETRCLSIENPDPIVLNENGMTLVDMFHNVAERYPERPAVEFIDSFDRNKASKTILNYKELNYTANSVAWNILSDDSRHEDTLISVCMEKSVLTYATILAILKVGAGYLPLTPETPRERIIQILEAAKVRVFVTTSTISDTLNLPDHIRVICLERDPLGINGGVADSPRLDIIPSTLAYAVFTSGSTGTPKGVLVTHNNIVSNVLALRKKYPNTPKSKLLQFCSIAFDVSVFEIFFTWFSGMCLCSGIKDILLYDLEGVIRELGVTHLSLTPTAAALVSPEKVPKVEFLVTAGEAVTPKVFKNWAGRGLYQGYGPSETTNICTVNPKVLPAHDINNIGIPFDNTSAFVLASDSSFSILPRGAVGELCFGGEQVFRGYLNMPELTSQKIIDHPVYGRVYRSGDMGRILPDGSMGFVNRKDEQVKIRGFRIELGDINSNLLRSDHIIDAATLAIPKSGDDNSLELVSFVVLSKVHPKEKFQVIMPSKDTSKVVYDLFSLLSSILPAYMVPNLIILVSEIPMTSQGKNDRRLLASACKNLEQDELIAFGQSSEDTANAVDKEWSATERSVANIFAKLGHVTPEEVRRNTSLFSLGLDSISAIQVSKQLEATSCFRLAVSQIMSNPTPVLLSKLLRTTTSPSNTDRRPAIGVLKAFADEVQDSVLGKLDVHKEAIDRILPCTPLQDVMLSQDGVVEGKSYFNHTTYKLNVDVAKLKAAWETIVLHTDMLKTSFVLTSHPQHPYAQVIMKQRELVWRDINLAPDQDTSASISKYIKGLSEQQDACNLPYALAVFRSGKDVILVLSLHHALYDGFSLDILLGDIKKVYYNYDLTKHQKIDSFLEYLEELNCDTADSFWKEQLQSYEPLKFPDLTGESKLAPDKTDTMKKHSAVCTHNLEFIMDGCKQQSISLNSLCQASWAKLLSAYSGEKDVCFGNVVNGRTVPVEGVETIIGPCFNTIPMRVQLMPGTTNEKLLKDLQKLNSNVLPYQLTPLRRIMNAVNARNSRLFDTLIILQHNIDESDGVPLWEMQDDIGDMDFSAVMEIVPNHKYNKLEIILHYSRLLISKEVAEQIVVHFLRVLQDCCQNPVSLVDDFGYLDKETLSIAGATIKHNADEEYNYIHTAFQKHAALTPNAICLEFLEDNGSTSLWTFDQVNKASNRSARILLSYTDGIDDAVVIHLNKGPKFYIAVLACLKMGHAFTPIDPTTPDQRKSFMVEELQARIVLVDTLENVDCLKLIGSVKVVEFDSVVNGYEEEDWERNLRLSDSDPQGLIYRLYTSGSTGKPKAVAVEISSALETIKLAKSHLSITSKTRLLQFAATTFDMCYFDCFLAWTYGFCLVSASRKHLVGDLQATIIRLNASMLDLTPTVARTLVADDLPAVETLYCIGEPMSTKLVQAWESRCVNSYGPTEAAMCCTMTSVNKEVNPANIGVPFANTTFYVLDPTATFVRPRLSIGELCIGGPQIARGYHANTGLTEERFIKLSNGERVFRTGDNVRMLYDGTFEYQSRTDDQVKIRGLRVELSEMNHVLSYSDRVDGVSTLVLQHSEDSKEQLVSFVSLRESSDHNKQADCQLLPEFTGRKKLLEDLRTAAKVSLPQYMIPGLILFANYIPLSIAGKVDKKVLKTLFSSLDIGSLTENKNESEDTNVAWTKLELAIREAFSKISDVESEKITRFTTIYELGLDSISVNQVVMLMRKHDLHVNAIDVLQNPTIRKLSMYMETEFPQTASESETQKFNNITSFQLQYINSICEEHSLQEEDIQRIHPCTSAQEGMISGFTRSDGVLFYNRIVMTLAVSTDACKLIEAWKSVVEHHEMLRCGFVAVDNEQHPYAMAVYHYDRQSIPVSLRNCEPGKDRDALAQQLFEINRRKAKENLHLPPWNLTIIKNEKTLEGVALFSAHHALYDARSLSLVFSDVAAAYRSQKLASKNVGVVLLQLLELASEDKNAFWKDFLADANVCKFPNLTPVRVSNTSIVSRERHISIKLSLLKQKCRSAGFTLQALGQSAWSKVLSAYTGEPDVIFGIVLSGRTGFAGAEDVPFPCLVTLPMRGFITDSNEELIMKIHEANLSLLKHQHTPLRKLQQVLGYLDRPMFDTLFVNQIDEQYATFTVDSLWSITNEHAAIDYAVSIEMDISRDGHLRLRATSKQNLIPTEQLDIILHQLDCVMVDLLQNPKVSCEYSGVLPKEVLSCLPAQYSKLPTEVQLLHEFVELGRMLHPNKVALEFATAVDEDHVEKKSWTYLELDEMGNRIANFLVRKGVQPDNLVVVCFDKCPEASFAMLGILKAGCGFLAIDYTAPVGRQAFIINDSKTVLVLTNRDLLDQITSAVGVEVVSLIDNTDILNSKETKTPQIEGLTSENVCYCLYTSGTTGTPKGCEITHNNAIQAMLSFQHIFKDHWDENSRFLQFASFHFDVSVLEQYWSWSVGICCTSAPRDVIFADIPLLIRQLEITHLDLTPSLASLLDPKDVPSLCRGVFITGGEQLKQEVIDTWGDIGTIYNGYGPTEVTIGCTMNPRVRANGKPSNIGPQFINVGSFVLAQGTDRPILRGAIGELCISGPLVGRGYLRRPDLTKERFPYLDNLRTRVYRTGDLVRLLYDGTFEFLGRADDQVKLRGQRLEIGEINETIKDSIIAVKNVATLVLKHPKQQRDQLVSFVVFEESYSPNKNNKSQFLGLNNFTDLLGDVLDACKRRLATYMIPTHFIPINRIPLSVNNKVDHKALTSLYNEISVEQLQDGSSGSQEVQGEIWTETEYSIRNILADLTKLEPAQVQKNTSFFELGLDSISMMTLSRRLRKAGFQNVDVSNIMQSESFETAAIRDFANYSLLDPTIARLSKAAQVSSIKMENLMAAANKVTKAKLDDFHKAHLDEVCEALSLSKDDIKYVYPCTSLQEGMLARSINTTDMLYFNTFLYRLLPGCDFEMLRIAWNYVVQNTDTLRTCFYQTTEGYAQVCVNSWKAHWLVHNASSIKGVKEKIVRGARDFHIRNKEDHQPPLLFQFGKSKGSFILAVSIFHALYDGNSWRMIIEDVVNTLSGASINTRTQFSDSLSYILSYDQVKAQDFWKKHLKDQNSGSFPRLCEQPSTGSHSVSKRISLTLEDMSGICKSANATPQAVLQAAWSAVLTAYTSKNITYGVVVSGRNITVNGVEDSLGPFFNTIPCLLSTTKSTTWKDMIDSAQEFVSKSIPFHHTPLSRIRKWLQLLANKPLFESLFVYQPTQHNGSQSSMTRFLEPLESVAEADYPLSIEIVTRTQEEFDVAIVASNAILDEDLSRGLIEKFEGNLQAILISLNSTISTANNEDEEAGSETVKEAESSPMRNKKFVWSDDAKKIRVIVANLAEMPEDEVSEKSSILELGLDSIEAIKLSAHLRKADINLSVSQLMKLQNILDMSQYLQKKPEHISDHEYESSDDVVFTPATDDADMDLGHLLLDKALIGHDVEAIVQATPLQDTMIVESISSDHRNYFNHDIWELGSDVDLNKLQAAFKDVVAKNPILRTTFLASTHFRGLLSFEYAQIIHSHIELPWTVYDAPNKDLDKVISRLTKQSREQIDYEKRVPYSFDIVMAEKKRYILLAISHALYDGRSLAYLHNDLREAYTSIAPSRPSYISTTFAVSNRDNKHSNHFWSNYLSDYSINSLPEKSLGNSVDLKIHRRELRSKLSHTVVSKFCRSLGITESTLGSTCWLMFLAHQLGTRDVIFGTVMSGRQTPEENEMMFPLMNTVPVRGVITGTFYEVLKKAQENAGSILEYQHTPLRSIQKLVKTNGQALFDTLFIYQKSQASDKENALWKSVGGESETEYSIASEMESIGDGVVWRVAASSAVMDRDDVQKCLQQLDTFMAKIINNPEATALTNDLSFSQQETLRVHGRTINKRSIEVDLTAVHSSIGECNVLVIEFAKAKPALVAILDLNSTTDGGSTITLQTIINDARKRLPIGSIPDYIIPLPAKVQINDTTALEKYLQSMSQYDLARYTTTASNDAQRDYSLEGRICQAISTVTCIPRDEINRSQTIFHMGLDSISAIRLASELRKMSIILKVGDILKEATVERMAVCWASKNNAAQPSTENEKLIRNAVDTDNNSPSPQDKKPKGTEGLDTSKLFLNHHMEQEDVQDMAFASPGQIYLISNWQSSKGAVFLSTFTFGTKGVIDNEKLQNAWSMLIQRTPILRTGFIATSQQQTPLVQIVYKASKANYGSMVVPSFENLEDMHELVFKLQRSAIDLKTPPARLFALHGPETTVIYITLHHALYDAISLPIILEKLQHLYCNNEIKDTANAVDSSTRYAIYCSSRDKEQQKVFWTTYLSNFKSTSLPMMQSLDEAKGYSSKRIELYKPQSILDSPKLEKRCRDLGISLHSLFLASFGNLLSQHLKKEAIVLGIYLANRHILIEGVEMETYTAPTLNFVPLRIENIPKASLFKVARKIQEDLISFISDDVCLVGLHEIAEWTGVQVDCFFNFLKNTTASSPKSTEQELFTPLQVDAPMPYTTGFKQTPTLERNLVKGVCQTRLDIEVAVRNGMIDMGVFTTEDYLTLEGAHKMLGDLRALVTKTLE